MSCLRQDTQAVGFDIVMTGTSIDSLLQFITASYNRRATQHRGHRAPLQIVKGTDRPYSVGAAYLSVVHAKVPDSAQSPAGSRFMPVAYLRPVVGAKGHLVIGRFSWPNQSNPSLGPCMKCHMPQSAFVSMEVIASVWNQVRGLRLELKRILTLLAEIVRL